MVQKYPLALLLSRSSNSSNSIALPSPLLRRQTGPFAPPNYPSTSGAARLFPAATGSGALGDHPGGRLLLDILKLEALDLAVERGQVDAEDFGGLGLVAANLGENPLDMLAFELLEG